MFWWLIILAPLGAILPGPIGEMFRAIEFVFKICCVTILALVLWSGFMMYNSAKCYVGGDEYNCEIVHELFEMPKFIGHVIMVPFAANPKYDAIRAEQLKDLDQKEQQERADGIARYRLRNGLPVDPAPVTRTQAPITQPNVVMQPTGNAALDQEIRILLQQSQPR